MRKTAKIFTLFLAGFFLILVFYPESLEAKEADLTINGEYFSANLKGSIYRSFFGRWNKKNPCIHELLSCF